MKFALNASVSVSFLGNRYLHAWIAHKFSTESLPDLYLVVFCSPSIFSFFVDLRFAHMYKQFSHSIVRSFESSSRFVLRVGGFSLTVQTARARQFSSFIVVVGKMLSGDTFDAKHALIVRDKDDLRIPLLCETIPSAKEFQGQSPCALCALCVLCAVCCVRCALCGDF